MSRWILIGTAMMFLLFGGFIPGLAQEDDLIPDAAFTEEGKTTYWTATGSEHAKFNLIAGETPGIELLLSEEGLAVATLEIATDPATVYRISFTGQVNGSGAIYSMPEGLENSKSTVTQSATGEQVVYYGLTGPEQTQVRISFCYGSLQERAKGIGRMTGLSVLKTDTIPAEATYVWLYDAPETTQEPEEKPAGILGNMEETIVCILILVFALCLCFIYLIYNRIFDPRRNFPKYRHWMFIGSGFCISILCAILFYGHSTDMTNFSLWSLKAAEVGLPDFYGSIWADYPPGYIYILYVIGKLGGVLGVGFQHPVFNLLIKLPAILCDAAIGHLIYRMARETVGGRSAANLCAFYVWNPMTILDGAIWGQVDSVLTLLTILMFWCYIKDRKPLVAALFAVGVLVKPQMLMFGPLMLVAYLHDIRMDWRKGLLGLGTSLVAGIVTFVVLIFPFGLRESNPFWIIDKYLYAANLYPYATVHAFNLYALFNANWAPEGNIFFLGMSYKTVGLIAIVLICLLAGILYLKKKDRRMVFPLGALVVWGIYAFGPNMHDRYLFPAIAFLLIAYAIYRRKSFLYAASLATAIVLTNASVSILFPSIQLPQIPVAIVSLVNIVGFIYCTTSVISLVTGKGQALFMESISLDPTDEDIQSENKNTDGAFSAKKESGSQNGQETDALLYRDKGKMEKKDTLILVLLTVMYGAVLLFRLGSTQVPQSFFRSTKAEESYHIDLGEVKHLASLYYYPGINKGILEIWASSDRVQYQKVGTIQTEYGNMYQWERLAIETEARYLRLDTLTPYVFLNEIGIYDNTGKLLSPVDTKPQVVPVTGQIDRLFDEPHLIDQAPTYMTEMYFDEIYHARSGLEQLNGYGVFETVHPPLGKMFISFGIALFGMNPFGWRIMGALFGVAIIPLFYVLAKRLMKKTSLAIFVTLLFMTDGMLFVQSRIATLDQYIVFFILSMVYFMYRYYEMNFFSDGLKKTLFPLGLCGISFGLGVATKWIGLYCGAGLAIVFFFTLFQRYQEYLKAKYAIKAGEFSEQDEITTEEFLPNVIKTLLFCCVFFLIIPAAIYLASYTQHVFSTEDPFTLQRIVQQNIGMFDYHSALTATHPYQSNWYTWPLVIKPMWFYSGGYAPAGTIESIATFGNPLVWWMGLLAVFYGIFCLIKKADRRTVGFLLVFLGAVFLPWVFITRAVFIYHYFASVPFIILLTGCMVKHLEKIRMHRVVKWMWAVACVGIFLLFYPVWSGTPVDREWAMSVLRWMPSWWFFSS